MTSAAADPPLRCTKIRKVSSQYFSTNPIWATTNFREIRCKMRSRPNKGRSACKNFCLATMSAPALALRWRCPSTNTTERSIGGSTPLLTRHVLSILAAPIWLRPFNRNQQQQQRSGRPVHFRPRPSEDALKASENQIYSFARLIRRRPGAFRVRIENDNIVVGDIFAVKRFFLFKWPTRQNTDKRKKCSNI